MSSLELQSKMFDFKYWIIVLVSLLVLSIALTPNLGSQYSRISDADLNKSGAWKVIDLARYSEGQASFTREVGATVTHDLTQPKPVKQIDIRLYSYGTQTNSVTLSVAGQSREFTYKDKGIFTHTELFDPPVLPSRIQLKLSELGQPAWVLDTLSITHGQGFDVKRVIWQMVLFAILTVILFFATQFTATPVSSSGKIYISIDIFRGIGALLVVLLHCTGYAGLPDLSERAFLGNIAKNGHYGVEVFYVISAFTLTYSLCSALNKNVSHPISTFWNRRVNRIIPTFLTMFVLAVLLRAYLSSGLTAENLVPTFIRFMSMTYIFERETLLAPIGHSVWWSISTEFQFYIIMPLLFFPVMAYILRDKPKSSAKNITLAVAMSLASIFAMSFTRGALSDKSWLAYTLFYHLDAFVVGIGLAIIMREWSKVKSKANPAIHSSSEDFATHNPRVWTCLAYLGFVGLLVVVAFSQSISQALSIPKSFVGGRLVVIIATAISLFAVRYCEEKGANLSGARALRTVGLLSFLIYLVHIPVLQIFTKISVPDAIGTDMAYYLWVVLGGMIGSIFVSVIIHRLIEIPSMRLNDLATQYPMLRAASTGLVIFIILAFTFSFAKY